MVPQGATSAIQRQGVRLRCHRALRAVGYAGTMAIDPTDARPLSVQITEDLRRRILADDPPVGKKFPSLRTLATEYGVAELTIHAAVKQLQHDGVLVSTAGRGTFVRALPDDTAKGDTDEIAVLRQEVAELRGRVESLERTRPSD